MEKEFGVALINNPACAQPCRNEQCRKQVERLRVANHLESFAPLATGHWPLIY